VTSVDKLFATGQLTRSAFHLYGVVGKWVTDYGWWTVETIKMAH